LGSAPASGAVGRALAGHSEHGNRVDSLVRSFVPVFGVWHAEPAAEAAALPIHFDCVDTARAKVRARETGFPTWLHPSRKLW